MITFTIDCLKYQKRKMGFNDEMTPILVSSLNGKFYCNIVELSRIYRFSKRCYEHFYRYDELRQEKFYTY
ncbi:hypothetical protein T11_12064 [Trichinella zimbabwensis]|uniref:Uncharacterized protein n=1 Tax=Trichinella zimbabwensis TaxID=268475 RepID=A0A0V1H5K3_9BILA|nr:hypothetical protein T11_12064 [Trichinella zimbabwensis]